VHPSINRVAAVLYFGVMLAVLANRAVYSALKRVPALCDKEERLRRDPRLAKGDQAASVKHKTCHLSAPSLGSGARAPRRTSASGPPKATVAAVPRKGRAASGALRSIIERPNRSPNSGRV
jgi:hypothetical protein